MKTLIGLAIGIIVLTIVSFSGCSVVGTGEAGLKTRFGKIVSEQPLDEGIYFYNPILYSFVTYDCRDHVYRCDQETFTKDVQYSKISLAVTYNINRASIKELHRKTGPQYESILVQPAIIDTLKNVIGTWEADKIMEHRPEIIVSITAELGRRFKEFGFNVKQIALVNIDFSTEFEKAVEAKQTAMQEAIKAKNITAKIEEEARQKVLTAEAEAKAMEAKAKALEKNKSLILFDAVQKWDGRLPTYMMGGAGNDVPFIFTKEVK